MNAQIEVLDAALKRVHEDVQRYFVLRDALWLADCTGEIKLTFPETMPSDSRSSREEQCRQLTLRRSGVRGTTGTDRH